MATHVLKTRKEYFEAILDGTKRFEIRKNDRGYQKGDIVYLEEIEETPPRHTGRVVKGMIGYVTNYGQKDDIVVFTFIPLPPDESMKGADNAPAVPGTAPSAGGEAAAPAQGGNGKGNGDASKPANAAAGALRDPARVGTDT